MPTGPVKVGVSVPTLLSSPLPGKGATVLFINRGPNSVYIGADGAVTSNYGAPLDPYGTLTMPADRAWYAIAAAAAGAAGQVISVVPNGIAASAQVGPAAAAPVTVPLARKQSLSAIANANTSSVTLTVSAGSTLFAAVLVSNNNAATCSDNVNGSWTLIQQISGTALFFLSGAAAGITTVTAGTTSNVESAIVVTEYAGVPVPAVVLGSAAARDGAAGTTHSSGSLAVAGTQVLLLGVVGRSDYGGAAVFTPAAGWVAGSVPAPNASGSLFSADQGVAAAVGAGTYAFTSTSDTSVFGQSLIAAVRIAA